MLTLDDRIVFNRLDLPRHIARTSFNHGHGLAALFVDFEPVSCLVMRIILAVDGSGWLHLWGSQGCALWAPKDQGTVQVPDMRMMQTAVRS
jgi:hypothetical protein